MKKIFSKKSKQRLCLFLSFLILFYTTACTYSKVNTTGAQGLASIGELKKDFVIHNQVENSGSSQLFRLTGPEVTKTHLVGHLAATAFNSVKHSTSTNGSFTMMEGFIEPGPSSYHQPNWPHLNTKDEKPILHEVNIFTDGPELVAGPVKIPLENIHEVRIIEKESGKTAAFYVLVVVGVIVVIFALLLIIAAATKSSCPYIYTYDGEGFIFQGEIYSGAILRNLERHDFMPLPLLQPVDGEYRLRLSNELKERQYTNLAELVVANHPVDSKVLLDSRGQPHLISNPILPKQALSDGGIDLSPILEATDHAAFLFNELEAEEHDVYLSFSKPENARTARLLVNAKNTLWLEYIFGEYAQKFGAFYEGWMEKQSHLPADQLQQQVIDQEFPLSTYLNTKNGWELVEHLPTVGPLAARDFVIPINLNKVNGEQVELRLKTGFFFWEIDYAAMDFTDPQGLDISRMQATLAVDHDGTDRRAELAADDDLYFAQPEPGMVAELHYPAVPIPDGKAQSVFLHAKGYYEHVRDYAGVPDFSELKKFREPGHFSEYSQNEYLLLLEGGEELLVAGE